MYREEFEHAVRECWRLRKEHGIQSGKRDFMTGGAIIDVNGASYLRSLAAGRLGSPECLSMAACLSALWCVTWT